MPFRTNEGTLLEGHETWSSTFNTNKQHISKIEKMFTPHVDSKWGDINQATIEASHDNYPLIDIGQDKLGNEVEKYDIMIDLEHAKYSKPLNDSCKSQFLEIAHPFLLRNDDYFNL